MELEAELELMEGRKVSLTVQSDDDGSVAFLAIEELARPLLLTLDDLESLGNMLSEAFDRVDGHLHGEVL